MSAAHELGIHVGTLTKWKQEEAFKDLYFSMRDAVLEAAVNRLSTKAVKAIETLAAQLDEEKPDKQKINAAGQIMNNFFKWMDRREKFDARGAVEPEKGIENDDANAVLKRELERQKVAQKGDK